MWEKSLKAKEGLARTCSKGTSKREVKRSSSKMMSRLVDLDFAISSNFSVWLRFQKLKLPLKAEVNNQKKGHNKRYSRQLIFTLASRPIWQQKCRNSKVSIHWLKKSHGLMVRVIVCGANPPRLKYFFSPHA